MMKQDIALEFNLQIILDLCEKPPLEIIKQLDALSDFDLKCLLTKICCELESTVSNEEQEVHRKLLTLMSHCIYHIIRSANKEALEILFETTPGNYFDSRLEELDAIVSYAYNDLKYIKNVPLESEMEFCIAKLLLNFRFLCRPAVTIEKLLTHDYISKRIHFLSKCIEELLTVYSDGGSDEQFVLISRHIVKNIFILKKLIKQTYLRIPWEEIEFCLLAYINSKNGKLDLINCIITSTDLIRYLKSFLDCLLKETENIKREKIKKLSKNPRSARDQVIEGILKDYPCFEELYQKYQLMRDNYSLEIISKYVKLAVSVDATKDSDQLVIMRALQVIGEHLKSTLESPKLSTYVNELLVFLFSSSSIELIKSVRNSLSHGMSVFKYQESNKEDKSKFFIGIQRDMSNIIPALTRFLHQIKFKMIKMIMEKLFVCTDTNEIKQILQVCYNFQVNVANICSSEVSDKFEELEILVCEFSKLLDKTAFVKNEFDEYKLNYIKKLISDGKREFSLFKRIYEDILFLWPRENIFYDEDIVKCKAARILHFIQEQNSKTFILEEISNAIVEFWKIYCPRVVGDKEMFDHLRKMIEKIIYITDFDLKNVKYIEKLNAILSRKENETDDELKMLKVTTSEEFFLKKIKLLKDILTEYDLNSCNFSDFIYFKNNTALQVKVEVVLLAILSDSFGVKFLLFDNILNFDDPAPFLTGRSLRNHLAHDNIANHVLLDETVAVFLNAKIFSEYSAMKISEKHIKCIKTNSMIYETTFEKDMTSVICQKELFLAVTKGSVERTFHWILKGADIRGRDNEMMPTLHYAASSSSLDCFKLLLRHGLSVHCKNAKKQSVLHLAAASGRKSILNFLITRQNMPLDEVDQWRRSPIHLATMNGHIEAVKHLLSCNAKCTSPDSFGLYPLHYAALNNQKELFCLLLGEENNVDLIKMWGCFTSLHLAAVSGHLNMVEYLIEKGADVNAKTDQGATALHNSVIRGHLRVVETLILHGADVNARIIDGRISLHNAAEKGHEKIVKILLEHGSMVDVVDSLPNTALEYLPSPLYFATEGQFLNIIEILIKNGAFLNNASKNGLSPFHRGVLTANKEIVKLFFENGAEINSKDALGFTPLHYSIENKSTDVIKFLIEKGADIRVANNEGLTPLHYAAYLGNYEAAEFLILKGADITGTDNEGHSPFHSCVVISQLPKMVVRGYIREFNYGGDALQIDEINRKIKIMELLISKGTRVESQNNFGETPLHTACLHKHTMFSKFLISKLHEKMVYDDMGYTPLHKAVMNNNLEQVKILLERKCDELINSKCFSGKTALNIAVILNFLEIAKILIQNGSDVDFCETVPTAVCLGFQKMTETLLKAENKNIYQLLRQCKINVIVMAAVRGHEQLLAFLLKEIKKYPVLTDFMKESMGDALIEASFVGHYDEIKILLKNGANVQASNEEGLTAMHLAAKEGHLKTVEVLLEYGADFNTLDRKFRRPIELAVCFNHLSIVQLLFEHKMVNTKNTHNADGLTLLHIASQEGCLETVKYLVNMGANIYSENNLGSKPIHVAARDGHIEIVEYFLNCKVAIDVRGCGEMTLLHYAAYMGQNKMCQYLINRGVDVNSRDGFGNTSLHMASNGGHVDTVKFLLENGACINCGNFLKMKPLNLSRDKYIKKLLVSTEELFQAVRKNNVSAIQKCIKEEAMVNVKDSKNFSILHYAVWKTDKNTVEILLKNKCNPNMKGKDDSMPLHYATKFNKFEIVKILLENGAIYNSPCKGILPINVTTDGKIYELLKLINNIFEDILNNRAKVIQTLEPLLHTDLFKAVVNAKNIRKNTIVVEAYRNDFSKIEQLKNLLEKDNFPMYNNIMYYESIQNYDRTLNLLQALLDKNEQIYGSESPIVLKIQEMLASCFYKQQKYEIALKLLQEIHKNRKETIGSSNLENFKTQSLIALILYTQGNYSEALEMFENTYAKQKDFLGENHADTLDTLSHMTLVLDKVNRVEEALHINRKLFEIYVEKFGIRNQETLNVQSNIGMSFFNLKKFEEAEEIFGQVHALQEELLGLYHSDTMRTLFYQLRSHIRKFSFRDFKFVSENVLKKLQNLLDVQTFILTEKNFDTLDTHLEIGEALLYSGRFPEALKVYSENLRKRKDISSPNDKTVLSLEKIIETIQSMPPIRYVHLADIRNRWEPIIHLFQSEL